MQKIAPCLWFDDKAEEAAKFYVSVRTSRSPSIGAAGGVRHDRDV